MKFFIYFVVTLLLCFTLWIVLVCGTADKPTQMSQWVYDAYEKKQKIAKRIQEKKIVIVAGSNALFGIDSKMLEGAFSLPVVNYGVNAGIELPCTLFMAESVINEGDIVLMPLEYPMYSYSGKPGVQMIDFILAREPECFWQLTWKEKFYILWHIKLQRVWEGYKDYENKVVKTGLYGAHHIDRYGDQIDTDISQRTDAMYNEVLHKVKHPEIYGQEFNTNALGWMYLERFVKWCKEHYVKIVFMPSTLMRHESYKYNEKEKWFYEHIEEEVRKKGWVYVGDPYDYMYAPSLYFNTNFHLIDSARKMRTEKMIEDLNKVLPQSLWGKL